MVFRVLAATVAAALLSTSGSALLQHVHAYADHDHAEHRHGPASHAHPTPPLRAPDRHESGTHQSDGAARLERCDPGEHTVAVVFTSVAPQPGHVPVPVPLDPVIVTPPELAWRHAAPSEVRAHSPPRLTDGPLRAPPLVHLA